MRKMIINRGLAVLLLGLIPLALATGCAEKIIGSGRTAGVIVVIDAKPLGAGAGAAADSYRLTVEGTGFDPIVTTLPLQGNVLTGTIEVPLGANRHFIAEGLYNPIGNYAAPIVLYRGETYADILSTGATEVAISLRPVVPMVKLSPHYQAGIMGDLFYYEVLVYNFPAIRSIAITLNENDAPYWVDSVAKGASLDAISTLSWGQGDVSLYLNFDVGERVASLTDGSGYAHLATVRMNSYADWGDSIAIATVTPYVSGMIGVDGDSLSLAGIYTDQAVVWMTAPILGANAFGGPGNEAGYAIQATPDGGIVAAGYTDSYGAGSTDAFLIGIDAGGEAQWQQTFGDAANDGAKAIIALAEGGYALAGYTYSYVSRSADVLLVRTDPSGAQVWARSYGGPLAQGGHAVARAPDGGYLVAGYAATVSPGANNVYILKTDSTGSSIWSKTFGGTEVDEAHALCAASDGGYVVVGDTWSYGAGGADVLMLKIDANGNQVWQKTFGGSADERGNAVAPTADGGYIIAGRTFSFGAGLLDMYLVKTDATGNLVWQDTFGGTASDEACGVAQTADGGYIVAGFTDSYGAGNFDAFLVKVDASGDMLWQKTCGGAQDDGANCLTADADGGFILAGWTNSFGNGGDDLYLLRTDSLGNLLNDRTIPSPTTRFRAHLLSRVMLSATLAV